MSRSFHLDIVIPEEAIFSGQVQKLFVPGEMGELEIMYGHAPLMTFLVSGPIIIVKDDAKYDGFVIYGGILEVQPDIVIVLADGAVRSQDINKQEALAVKERIENSIASRDITLDYNKAHIDLVIANAKLRIMRMVEQ